VVLVLALVGLGGEERGRWVVFVNAAECYEREEGVEVERRKGRECQRGWMIRGDE